MIIVTGAESAYAAAARLEGYADAIDGATDELVEERMAELLNTVRAYDAPPLPSYRRTGRLGASWYLRREGSGWLVGRGSPYAGLVRGDAGGGGQAWMHVGRWRLFSDIVQQALDLRAALVEKLRGLLG